MSIGGEVMDVLIENYRDILKENKQDYVLFEYEGVNGKELGVVNVKNKTTLLIEDEDLEKALIDRMVQDNFPIMRDFEEIRRLHNSSHTDE